MAASPKYEAHRRDGLNIDDASSGQQPSFTTQLQATLNVIPAYTWYADPSGALTFVNKRLADYLGLPKDHPLRFGIAAGAAWDSHIALLHPDDHEESRKVWSTCVRTGCAGNFTFRVRNAEGVHRWFLTRAEPLRASDGTLLYWIGVNLEIDELKQAQFYLSEGQRLTHMGSWAFNPTGFEYWSSELFRVHGLNPNGKPPTVEEYLDLVHPEDREFVMREIQNMLANNCAFEFTKRIVRPDGNIRRVRCVGIPTNSAGTAQRFVGTGLDVTEQEQLMEERERLLAINKELEIARKIQSSILPQKVPTFRGLEIVARYVPMSAVAGDFYDFLCIDERRVGILVADVTGHGVPAALIASMLKVAFAGQAAHAHDPARVLDGLNRSLCGKFESHFVTAAYVFVDLEKGLLLYSGAAHPPLMLTSDTAGKVREIEENGLMLGLFPEAVYSSAEIQVGPGERCLLYTDGILEATNAAQEQFGTSRCKEFLETHRETPAARFADIFLDSIAAFSGYGSARAQKDDITLVVLDFQ